MVEKVIWKPSNLPWRAMKKGTERYIWFEIVDNNGWEVAKFGAVTQEEEDQLFSTVALTLMSVNKTRRIQVDGQWVNISYKDEIERKAE